MDTATTIAPAAVEFSTEELEAALIAKGFKVKLTEVHEKEAKVEKTEAERLVEALGLVAKVEVKEDGTAVIVILPTEEIEANVEAKLVMAALGEKARTTMEKIEKARRLAAYTGKPRGRKPGVKAEAGTETGTSPEAGTEAGTEAPAA